MPNELYSTDLIDAAWALMDGQSVKTTESGGVRGFDVYKRVKGRKRRYVGLPIANSVEPANISDRYAAERCWPA